MLNQEEHRPLVEDMLPGFLHLEFFAADDDDALVVDDVVLRLEVLVVDGLADPGEELLHLGLALAAAAVGDLRRFRAVPFDVVRERGEHGLDVAAGKRREGILDDLKVGPGLGIVGEGIAHGVFGLKVADLGLRQASTPPGSPPRASWHCLSLA